MVDRVTSSLFSRVLQNGSGFGVDANFVGDRPDLDVEGVTQAGAALAVLELLIENCARLRLRRGGAGLIEGDRSFLCEAAAAHGGRSGRGQKSKSDQGRAG